MLQAVVELFPEKLAASILIQTALESSFQDGRVICHIYIYRSWKMLPVEALLDLQKLKLKSAYNL